MGGATPTLQLLYRLISANTGFRASETSESSLVIFEIVFGSGVGVIIIRFLPFLTMPKNAGRNFFQKLYFENYVHLTFQDSESRPLFKKKIILIKIDQYFKKNLLTNI